MEKLIKIKARMTDGTVAKYRTTSFTVKPFRNAEGLYITLDDNYTFACKSIIVEQKEVEPKEVDSPLKAAIKTKAAKGIARLEKRLDKKLQPSGSGTFQSWPKNL